MCGCYHSTYFETWLNKQPQMIQLALGINKNRYKKTMWHSLYVPWLADRGGGGIWHDLDLSLWWIQVHVYIRFGPVEQRGEYSCLQLGEGGGGGLLHWPIINCGGWHFARSVTGEIPTEKRAFIPGHSNQNFALRWLFLQTLGLRSPPMSRTLGLKKRGGL